MTKQISIEALLRETEQLKDQNEQLKTTLHNLSEISHRLAGHPGKFEDCEYYECARIRQLTQKDSDHG